MDFWHTDLLETQQRYSLLEMKQILDANGITQVEVEWLLDWYCTDARRTASDQTRKLLLDAAEILRARYIKVADLGNDCADVPQLTEEFSVLCKQAADRGTNVLFEMLPAPFSRVPSLDHVMRICEGSGARNGGIMLDNLHMQRTGTPAGDLIAKIDPGMPLGVEINDGALATPVNLLDSVVNRRLLPGDGEFDIAAFLDVGL